MPDAMTTSWTVNVMCSHCRDGYARWSVLDGVWTCQCGKAMTASAIRQMQKTMDLTQ